MALKLMIAGMIDLKSWTNLMVSDSDIVRNMKREEREEVTRKACVNSIRNNLLNKSIIVRILRRYCGDQDVVLAAVKLDVDYLMYAKEKLRRNPEFKRSVKAYLPVVNTINGWRMFDGMSVGDILVLSEPRTDGGPPRLMITPKLLDAVNRNLDAREEQGRCNIDRRAILTEIEELLGDVLELRRRIYAEREKEKRHPRNPFSVFEV